MLGLVPQPVRAGVGEDEYAVVALDGPAFAANIARQAGMGRRVDISGDHPVARTKARRDRSVDPGRCTGSDERLDHFLG